MTLKAGALLDFDAATAQKSYSFSVVAADGVLPTANKTTQAVTVTVKDVAADNDVTGPVFISSSTATAIENQNLLYTAVATDATTPVTYSLFGTDAGLLDINAATGAVTLKTGQLDFDAATAQKSYSFNVVAMDSAPTYNRTTQAVTVTVKDVAADNDVTGPTFTSLGTVTAIENQNLLYMAATTDATTPVTYSLFGTDAGLLDINAATGAVTLKTGQLDFDAATAQKSYSFNVVAMDSAPTHNQTTQAVTVTVTDVATDNDVTCRPSPLWAPSPQ